MKLLRYLLAAAVVLLFLLLVVITGMAGDTLLSLWERLENCTLVYRRPVRVDTADVYASQRSHPLETIASGKKINA